MQEKNTIIRENSKNICALDLLVVQNSDSLIRSLKLCHFLTKSSVKTALKQKIGV